MEVAAVYLQTAEMEPDGHMRKASESDSLQYICTPCRQPDGKGHRLSGCAHGWALMALQQFCRFRACPRRRGACAQEPPTFCAGNEEQAVSPRNRGALPDTRFKLVRAQRDGCRRV